MSVTQQNAAANPLRIADPERIPAGRYYDPAFYALENEHLWPHVWQMACREEQIPEIGDWIEYSNLGKSVIVVRTKHGVRAHHNVCRHRGVQLMPSEGSGNCRGQGFICPFHGWRWNIDGRNTFVYSKNNFSEQQLDVDDLALPQAKVELWGGFVFINFDHDAPSLRAQIGPMLDNLDARNMDSLRAEWWFTTELPANWKIAMEAFMEGYHVLRTHPQLHQAQPARYNQRYGQDTGGHEAETFNPNMTIRENVYQAIKSLELVSIGMGGMVQTKELEIIRGLADVDLPDEPGKAMASWMGMVQAEISKQLAARGENVPDLPSVSVTHPVSAVEFIFPHTFLLPTFTSMAGYRIRPTGPETCRFEIFSLTQFPKGQEPDPVEITEVAYDSKDLPPIPQQDYANIPEQQKGMHAEGFEFMRLSRTMEGLISNYQRIIDGYIAKVPPEALAKATHVLGGNFDGPIVDLGF